MNYWLMKSEPETFSIDDLRAKYPATEPWDGVRNYQVRNMMRDEMQPGDRAFFYHSNCKPPGIAGELEIVSMGYADRTAFDPESDYFDAKSTETQPRWFCVDVRFVKKYRQLISLDALKNVLELSDLPLIKRGNRLSIMPLSAEHWSIIQAMADQQ